MNTEPRQVRMTLSTVEGQCSRLLPVATDGLRVATANKATAIIVGFNFWEVCRNLSKRGTKAPLEKRNTGATRVFLYIGLLDSGR